MISFFQNIGVKYPLACYSPRYATIIGIRTKLSKRTKHGPCRNKLSLVEPNLISCSERFVWAANSSDSSQYRSLWCTWFEERLSSFARFHLPLWASTLLICELQDIIIVELFDFRELLWYLLYLCFYNGLILY